MNVRELISILELQDKLAEVRMPNGGTSYATVNSSGWISYPGTTKVVTSVTGVRTYNIAGKGIPQLYVELG